MILITGGFGFIGNEVVRQLASKYGNENVHVLDNFSRIAEDIADLNSISYSKIDIRDFENVDKLIENLKPQTIIHLAALHFIPECNANPLQTIETNSTATLEIVLSALKNKVEHFVFASSGAVYSDWAKNIHEEFDCLPVDIYGYSKMFAENLIQLYLKDSPVKVSICRFFNNYGPRETNPHILPEIINQLKKNGDFLELGNIDSIRDYIYVEDTAKVISLIMSKQEKQFATYNIGSGSGNSVRELIQKIEDILGIKIMIHVDPNRIRKVDKKVQVADISKIKEFDFKPIPIDDGLKHLLEFEGLN